MTAKKTLATALFGILAANVLHVSGAAAQEYPAKPVSFIVHSSPGSGTDVTARTIANILEKEKLVRQRVVIENKTGGSGAVAISYVAGKTADPYTIWIVAANVVIGQPLRAKMKVTYKDFTPIAMLAKDPSIIAVRADSPYKTVKDLVTAAREGPKPIIAGVASVGGAGHITTAMLATGAGVKFSHVFFKGGAEAVVALLGGHVDFVAENPSEVFPLLQAKQLRLIGTATERRLADFPEVPTLKELGINAVFEIGRGVFGPKDIPRDVVRYWGTALEKMVKTPAWKKYVQDHQMVESFMNDAELARFLDDMAGPLTQTMTSLGLLKE